MSWLFTSGGQSIGVSASASVLTVNIQDWFPLGWTGLISLQSEGLSRVFSNTTVRKHQFFSAQPFLLSNSHICTWLLEKKHSLLNRVLINNIFLAKLTELLLKSCDTMYVKVPSTAMKAEQNHDYHLYPWYSKWKVKVKSLSHVWLFATTWTAAYQAPLSIGFSREEYWSGVPLPSPDIVTVFPLIP